MSLLENNDNTAVRSSSYNNNFNDRVEAVVSILMEYNANVDMKTAEGWAALMFAAQNGYIKLWQLYWKMMPAWIF